MSGLTCVRGLAPAAKPPGRHYFRRVRAGVLVVDDAGRGRRLSAARYRAALLRGRGLPDQPSLGAPDAALLAWKGPRQHVIRLESQGRPMPLETLRAVLDFAFGTPSPELGFELVVDDPERRWPAIWLACRLAERKAEWAKRRCEVTVRADAPLLAGWDERLARIGARVRRVIEIKGAPRPAPSAPGGTALALVAESARDPGGWAARLSEAGYASVRLDPAGLPGARAARRYSAFYKGFVGRLLAARVSLREEWADAFLRRAGCLLPGNDVLSELAYSPEGDVYTSERGLGLALAGDRSFHLGRVGALDYAELGGGELVQACVAACYPDAQPRCGQCVYKSFCSLPPSANYERQGTIWGQTPESPLCAMRMSMLDFVVGKDFDNGVAPK